MVAPHCAETKAGFIVDDADKEGIGVKYDHEMLSDMEK